MYENYENNNLDNLLQEGNELLEEMDNFNEELELLNEEIELEEINNDMELMNEELELMNEEYEYMEERSRWKRETDQGKEGVKGKEWEGMKPRGKSYNKVNEYRQDAPEYNASKTKSKGLRNEGKGVSQAVLRNYKLNGQTMSNLQEKIDEAEKRGDKHLANIYRKRLENFGHRVVEDSKKDNTDINTKRLFDADQAEKGRIRKELKNIVKKDTEKSSNFNKNNFRQIEKIAKAKKKNNK